MAFLSKIVRTIDLKRYKLNESKATENINEQGQLSLDHPFINNKNSRVEVIVLISEESENSEIDQTKEEIVVSAVFGCLGAFPDSFKKVY